MQEKKGKPDWVPRDVGGDKKGAGGAGRGRTSLVASVSLLSDVFQAQEFVG